MTIVVKPVQFWKALFSMVLTDSGSASASHVSALHPKNAYSPTVVGLQLLLYSISSSAVQS